MHISRRHILVTSAASSALMISATGASTAFGAEPPESRVKSAIGDSAARHDYSLDVNRLTFPAAFTAEMKSDARKWATQQIEIARLLQNKGQAYTFVCWWEAPSMRSISRSRTASTAESADPTYGSNFHESFYDWSTAGARGKIVHDDGLDSAH